MAGARKSNSAGAAGTALAALSALVAVLATAGTAPDAGAPAPPGTPVVSAPSGTPDTATSPTAFTLSTPMLRTAAEWLDPAVADWTGRLPEMRLRMDSGQGFSLRAPGATLGGLGVRGVEFALPRVPGLWVGVEGPDDPGESRRATLSIQKQF